MRIECAISMMFVCVVFGFMIGSAPDKHKSKHAEPQMTLEMEGRARLSPTTKREDLILLLNYLNQENNQ